MAYQRTMTELLRVPTEGYAEAIVVPSIIVEHFELKYSLINMMTSDQFFGLEKDNPHDHIRWFNKITSTIKYKDVPNSAIKLMLFPFSLVGAARRRLEKEPPHSILTWEDLVYKFTNEFFPPSRTTNLRNEISNFQQRFDESFHEAWDRYKYLLRACPHHGFTELHQLDTFYNALNPADQDSLNSAAGGNLLERRTQDVLTIIENKSMVRNSLNKLIASQVESNDANSSSSSEIAKLTHAVNQQTSAMTTAMTAILKQFQATPPPAFVKVVEEICVICGGPLPSNTIANPKGELKAITTRSGIVLDGPSVPMPPLFINPKEDEREEETLTDLELAEDPLHPNIPYPSRMHKQKQQEKDEKMIKALLSNKEKLLELAITSLNENCLAVILKKLPKKLGDPGKFLIPCGFTRIARDVFVPVGKFTFPADFFIVDYESDLRVPLVLGRPFLQDFLKDLFATNNLSGNPTFSSHPNLTSPEVKDDIFDPEGDMEFADELALITFPPGNDDLPFDIESDLKEIEYLLNHDPIKEMDSILEDSINKDNLVDLNDNLVDTMPEMFTDEHSLDYSSLSLYDEYDDDLFEVESSDFLPSPEYDSFLFEDFSKVDALPSTNNKDKVFNPGILIQENLSEVITHVALDKNVMKIAISHASLILKDFDPHLYELPFHKEVLGFETTLFFLFENEEKVFKPEILTSKGVHTSLLLELSNRGSKAFKVIKILKSRWRFLFAFVERTSISWMFYVSISIPYE
uniref:Reverse transcriptase domain-containing protein n=1 Tax=Tanacetum cinerariifolium TaxID=118510 RepID=A0A6L2KCQ1_TANCI|nr:reverse transcriptase domain-containing protein [Tanacetum cinerariifolium]